MAVNNMDDIASMSDQSNLKKRRLLRQSEEPGNLQINVDFMNGSHFSEEIDSYCISIGTALTNMTPQQRSSAMIRMNQLLIVTDNACELRFKDVGCQTLYKHVLSLGELPEPALRVVLSQLAVVDLLRLRAVDSNFRKLVDSVFRSELVMLNRSYARRFKGGELERYKMTDIPPSVGSKVRRLWMDKIDGDVLINGGCCSELMELRANPENPFIGFSSGFLRCQEFLRFENLEIFDGILIAKDVDLAIVDTILTRLRRCKLIRRFQLTRNVLHALLKMENPGDPVDCVRELVLPSEELVASTKLFELFPSCDGFIVKDNVASLEFLQFLPSGLRILSLAMCSVVFDKSDLCHLSSLHNLVEFSFEQFGDVSSFPDFIYLTSFCYLQNFRMKSKFFTSQDFAYVPLMAPLQRVAVLDNTRVKSRSTISYFGASDSSNSTDPGDAGSETILEQLLSRESCAKLIHVQLSEPNDPDVVCELVEQHSETLESVSVNAIGSESELDAMLAAVPDRLISRLVFFDLGMGRDILPTVKGLVDFIERRARLYRDPTVSFPFDELELTLVDCHWDEPIHNYLHGLAKKAFVDLYL